MIQQSVLLTGATGFLGSHLATQLVREGYRVHALCRAGANRRGLAGLPVHLHEGDLTDAASVERAVRSTCRINRFPLPAVIHSGAVISYRTRDRELQRAVNVDGTRALLDACRRHPVGRVLHISSVVTVGHSETGEALNEEASYNGAELHCDYVDTKREAEELALAAADELDITVVNPGAIFGGGPRSSNSQRLLRLMNASSSSFLGAPPGELSVVGVEDVARGCVLALQRGARGRRYILTESNWSMLELFRLGAAECGRRGPSYKLPRPLWSTASALVRWTDALQDRALLTPQALRLSQARFRFDSTRAQEELAWEPQPFREVLQGVVSDMQARGVLS